MKLELTEGDCLEVSDDTPMYNPQVLTLKLNKVFFFPAKDYLSIVENLYPLCTERESEAFPE